MCIKFHFIQGMLCIQQLLKLGSSNLKQRYYKINVNL